MGCFVLFCLLAGIAAGAGDAGGGRPVGPAVEEPAGIFAAVPLSAEDKQLLRRDEKAPLMLMLRSRGGRLVATVQEHHLGFHLLRRAREQSAFLRLSGRAPADFTLHPDDSSSGFSRQAAVKRSLPVRAGPCC